MTENTWNFAGLRALFINCTLKRIAADLEHAGTR